MGDSPAPKAGEPAPPVALGRYEILGKLGTGGMATVYLARNAGELGFQRLCAVKVLHPHLAEEPGFIQMLLDEAKIAARIHHPNVVPIVDLGTHDDILYVAMEYVEGCSLSALIKKRPDERPPNLLVPIMLDALAGLDAAHSLTDDDGTSVGVVHRDVSPQNVLIGIDGTARLTDFGIARASSRVTSTRPGQLKGKIAYMSPEQVRSSDVDQRSDLFSAGAMLWSLLTGRKLFAGENDAATMNNIVNLEIPLPSTMGFMPPAAFDAVCMRALERDPAKRFATAREMEEALRAAAASVNALAPRREVGEWIVRSFREELAERRKAIRAAAANPAERAVLRTSTRTTSAEFPSFTPSTSNVDAAAKLAPMAVVRAGAIDPGAGDTLPSSEPIITITHHGDPKRRLALWIAPPAVLLAIVGWFALRGTPPPPTAAAPPPTDHTPPPAKVATTPPPAPATAPAPTPAPAPAVATPTPAPPPPPHHDVAPVRPIVHHPAVVVRHAPLAVKATPPPATTPPAPPPSPPPPTTKPQRWDPDSPAPPQ
ncbi:MAG TPA: serine/threonine-protein kinase [Kofleriaceae bacterium]|nr:serine/threonine-protein kinase [Kofleriaceae bacterium]